MKLLDDGILRSISDEFDTHYARTGWLSVPPGRLLRALLLQVLYTLRAGRQSSANPAPIASAISLRPRVPKAHPAEPDPVIRRLPPTMADC